jgi:hypothetical protein
LTTSWAKTRPVVSKISGGLVVVALSLLVTGAASALPPQYRDFAPTRSAEVRCDQLTTVTVTHPRSRRPAKVGTSLGWRVGSSVTNARGIPVAVIAATERVRDADGDLGIQWTLRGAYDACDDPAGQHFIDWSFGIRVRTPKIALSECGKVRMLNFTRAQVLANGYTPTCRSARSVASAWSRYQTTSTGVHPMRKFSTPSRIRGYRCSGARPVYEYSVQVRCRRGRARVRWEWGD